MNYNEFCSKQNCPHYIEWSFSVGGEDDNEEYPCVSCKLQGQSYDITEIAEDCQFGHLTDPTKERRK